MAQVAVSKEPAVGEIGWEDLRAALRLGWQDFLASPFIGLSFGAVFALGGLLIYLILQVWGTPWMILPLALGFPLIGPFLAVGLYEVSRRRELGLPLDAGAVLGVVFRQKDRQIPSMCAVIVGLFLAWTFLGHSIFALFMGLNPETRYASTAEMLLSAEGIGMLTVGSLVGAGVAFVLYGITVVSLPLLLDRELDFVTAMITSFGVVRHNPVPMLGWGIFLGALTLLAMLPVFLGLLVVFPLFGHASWHLYRRAVLP
ncbi:MAG TPA: DUF2189 domain-containing protein [Paracoccaceae bacterium]|nr:DUF2189 domain-containing protein [Paracoccaceae bacterium]